MKLRKGNMFDHVLTYDCILITTNADVRKDGALVMGRGAALEVKKRWPHVPYALGDAIKKIGDPYLLTIPVGISPTIKLGAFQVKHHWMEEAKLDLIAQATIRLKTVAQTFPFMSFALNFPGIGNGKLDRDDVYSLIQHLPDNVDVWEL